MDVSRFYHAHFESQLRGRYIALHHLEPVLSFYKKKRWCEKISHSENGLPVYKITMGNGPKKVLVWSQMHGNESTTTKAIMDFIKIISSNAGQNALIDAFLNEYTLHILPMLNPDGAMAYTRENANGVDLNRDAKELTQCESRLLRKIFDDIKPSLCLNLHDQRTIYSLPGGKSATLSFLSPSVDKDRSLTPNRVEAMKGIALINAQLQQYLPGQIGRYDDVFNDHCVGDRFQMAGIPTILFEAGHYSGDYEREMTRKYVVYALMALFGLLNKPAQEYTEEDYFKIPENEKNLRDVVLRNAYFQGKKQDVALQYTEVLQGNKVHWVAEIDQIGELASLLGHREIDFEGNEILVNSNENVFVGKKVATILDKKLKKIIKI